MAQHLDAMASQVRDELVREAAAAVRAGDLAGAEKLMERLGDSAHAALVAGRLHLARGSESRARAAFSLALQRDAGLVAARTGRALASIRVRQFDSALDDLLVALAALSPGSTRRARPVFRLLSHLFGLQGDVDRARRTVDSLRATWAGHADYQVLTGEVLSHTDLRAEGRGAFLQALEIEPGHARAAALLREWFGGASR